METCSFINIIMEEQLDMPAVVTWPMFRLRTLFSVVLNNSSF